MITRDDWLKALSEAHPEPENIPGVMTCQELADMLGVNFSTAKRRVLVLMKQGKAQETTKRVRVGSGTRCVTAYRLMP